MIAGVDVAVPFFIALGCILAGLVLCRRHYDRIGR